MENLYLNWQDRNTFVGVGEIIEELEEKPVVCFDNNCFLPKRCLVEIIHSDEFPTGFRKHFIIPFSIGVSSSKKLLKKEAKEIEDKEYFGLSAADEIMSRDNPITETDLDLDVRNYYLKLRNQYSFRGKRVPEEKIKHLEELKKRADEYREAQYLKSESILYKQSVSN